MRFYTESLNLTSEWLAVVVQFQLLDRSFAEGSEADFDLR